MSTRSAPSRRGGFSLVEVAIALALFVFGALAIVQIFPPALAVIRNNESRVIATQIGESTLAQLQDKGAFSAEAVYDGDSTTWNDIPYAVVGTATKNNSVAKSVLETDFQQSALGHFKYVKGEKHVARLGGYVLLPFSTASIDVYQEDVIEGVQISAPGILDFSNAKRKSNGAAFSDTAGQENRPPDEFRWDDTIYYVSYRWRDTGTGRVNGVIDEAINIPPDLNWGNDSARVAYSFINNANRILPGGVSVRIRRRLTLPAGSINPERGLVTGLTAGQKYSFDYTVSDWRWLVHDDSPRRETPTGATFISSLPIKGIADPPYYGLLIRLGGTTDPTAPISIRPKTGEALYTITSPGSWQRTRTVYKAIDGWTHQLSVAARSYVPYYTDAQLGAGRTPIGGNLLIPREAWREYAWDGGGNLYFHASEAGKSVSVSFEYDDAGTPRIISTLLTIRDDIEDVPAAVVGFAPSGKVTRAEITDLSGTPISATAILSVQGMSIHARTAWFNNDRYNQVIVPAYRTLMQ